MKILNLLMEQSSRGSDYYNSYTNGFAGSHEFDEWYQWLEGYEIKVVKNAEGDYTGYIKDQNTGDVTQSTKDFEDYSDDLLDDMVELVGEEITNIVWKRNKSERMRERENKRY